MKEKDKEVLNTVFNYFQKALSGSPPARNAIKQLGLTTETLKKIGVSIGYNSAQFHHRQNSHLIKDCVRINLLKENPSGGYQTLGKQGLIFPLRDQAHEIVNLYAFKIGVEETIDVFLNQEGIFPFYPKAETRKIIVATSVIETCLLLQIPNVSKEYSIITQEEKINTDIIHFFRGLTMLEEIVFVKSLANMETLQETLPDIKVSVLPIKEEDTIPSILPVPTAKPFQTWKFRYGPSEPAVPENRTYYTS